MVSVIVILDCVHARTIMKDPIVHIRSVLIIALDMEYAQKMGNVNVMMIIQESTAPLRNAPIIALIMEYVWMDAVNVNQALQEFIANLNNV